MAEPERGVALKPEDREVVCHASAWNLDGADDTFVRGIGELQREALAAIVRAAGAVGGAIVGRPGRGAMVGAASGATGGFLREGDVNGLHKPVPDLIAVFLQPGGEVALGHGGRDPGDGRVAAQLGEGRVGRALGAEGPAPVRRGHHALLTQIPPRAVAPDPPGGREGGRNLRGRMRARG